MKKMNKLLIAKEHSDNLFNSMMSGLRKTLPGSTEISGDQATLPTGISFIDCKFNDVFVVVAIYPGASYEFGVSRITGDEGLTYKSDDLFQTCEEAIDKVLRLLFSGRVV